jgi:hypothetical protein
MRQTKTARTNHACVPTTSRKYAKQLSILIRRPDSQVDLREPSRTNLRRLHHLRWALSSVHLPCLQQIDREHGATTCLIDATLEDDKNEGIGGARYWMGRSVMDGYDYYIA